MRKLISADELMDIPRAVLVAEQIERFKTLKECDPGAAALQVLRERRIYNNTKKEYFRHLSRVYGCQCLACGCHEKLTIDHIIPISLGGATTWENLQILCWSCNSIKRTKVIDYRPGRQMELQ